MGASETAKDQVVFLYFHKSDDVHMGVSEESLQAKGRDFPGGTVVKNPPANAGDTGSSPGPGRYHMPRSN